MALSKLKIKPIDRDNLYFNKYLYRVFVKAPNLYWVQYMRDIDEYVERIASEHDEYTQRLSNSTYHHYYGIKYTPDPIDYPLVSHLIDLRRKYFNNKIIGMRNEGNTICVYTNDLKIVESIVKVKPNVGITQSVVAPKGIKYFKKEPPAKYRAYMNNSKQQVEFKDDMIEYLERTPDIRPSKSFEQFLAHRAKVNHQYGAWLWSNYFVDYDDERNLMMLMLMFPGAIGKTYKLEKK